MRAYNVNEKLYDSSLFMSNKKGTRMKLQGNVSNAQGR